MDMIRKDMPRYDSAYCIFNLVNNKLFLLSHMDCVRIFDTIADCADIDITERKKMYDALVDKLGLEG